MKFHRVEIMHWIKRQSKTLIDLASSGIPSPYKLADLGLDYNEIPLSGDNYYGYSPLKEILAARYDMPLDHIAITPGASMANYMLMTLLLDKGSCAEVEHPTYEPFIRLVETITGQTPERIKRDANNEWHLPRRDNYSPKKAPVVTVFTNLHNPTGAMEKDEVFIQYADQAASTGGWILVDEIFRPFLSGGECQTLAARHKHIITTSSLTKAWGLSGLRIGWIFAPPEVIQKVEVLRDLMHVNQPFLTEYIAAQVLQPEGAAERLLQASRQRAEEHRRLVLQTLQKYPRLTFTPPAGGLSVLVRFKDGRKTDEFCEILKNKYNTLVVPGRFFEIPEGFRLTFGTETTMLELGLERLDNLLTKEGA